MPWIVAVVALLAAALVPMPSADAQNPTDIVINEVFYHPPCTDNFTPCADAPAEFIELYNSGGTTIDIGGWAIEDGVTHLVQARTELAPGDYYVVADNAAGFQSFFGQAPDGVWSGGLSNSGERIALIDDLGLIVDQLTYSDGSNTPGAWAVGADGDGDSLSLLSAGDDDGSSFWWDGATPTPGAVNANDGQSPSAVVANFTWTVLPGAQENLVVSADVFGGQNVSLQYRINYPGSNVDLPMTNIGGDTWRAEIPASAYDAGELVRFRILNGGNRVAPRQDDTIDWVGTTVADPSVDSSLPVMEWFTSDANYNAGYNEQGSQLHDGVLAYNGQVWDNLGFRIRGAIARSGSWSKRNWKFKLPDHHDFFIDGISYGLDSIDLQGGFADEARVRELVGHTVADQMGLIASQVQHVQLRLNGEFFGLHTLQEHPEGGFLKDNGLDNATLYKRVNLQYEAGPNVSPATSVGFETWDIPEYINLLAAASVIQNNDFAHGNFYAWYDADEHQRIEGMVWDLDLSQGIRYAPDDGLTVALENGSTWSYVWHRWKNQADIFEQGLSAPYRELYLRRLRTLADEWFGTGRYEQLIRATFDDITGANGGANIWALDTARWGFWGGQSYSQTGAVNRFADSWIDQYYQHILNGGPNGDIPGAQPANPNLALSVDATPGPGQHIRIDNNDSTAIDMSGWTIQGSTNAELPPGSVIGTGSAVDDAYIVDDDTSSGYRSVTTNKYVLGEYGASLDPSGGELRLVDANGVVHAEVAWGDGAPPPGMILNEWNAVSSSRTLLDGDTRLGSITGNGGDWFELVIVEDLLDIRGWRVEIYDNGEIDQTLTFRPQDVFAELRAGTIITISENTITAQDGTVYPQDPSYRPEAGDWWIHLVGGGAGSGSHIDAANFKVSEDDWQIAIYDDAGVRRFGPVGEGIGALTAGVGNDEIGELEADPSVDIDAFSPYDDGDASTFGLPNEFGGGVQDFSPLRPELYLPGDVNCNDATEVLDALLIAQYDVGLRSDSNGCPLADPENQLNVAAGDFNDSGGVDVLDALILAQCTVNIDNAWCPPDDL